MQRIVMEKEGEKKRDVGEREGKARKGEGRGRNLMWLHPSSFSMGVLQRGHLFVFAATHKAFARSSPSPAAFLTQHGNQEGLHRDSNGSLLTPLL
jgi:hypothetical protein